MDLRLALAAPRPARAFTSRYVAVGGLRLHVRTRPGPGGRGPQWVLLHGLAVSHRYLMPTATELPGGVHLPDLPGFGLSGHPGHVYDVAEHAAAVAGWMDADGLSGVVLLAGSFGCQVAVELAVERPDLVSALVLTGPTMDPAAPRLAGQFGRLLRAVPFEDPRQALIIARDVYDAGPARVLRTARLALRHPIIRRLPLVRVPVLVLRGEHDTIAPPEWTELAARLSPDGRAAVVPRAAHNIVTTAGPRVAALAADFARRIGQTDSSV